MSLRGTTPRVVLATSLGLLAGYSTYRYRVSRRAPIESHPSGRSAPGPLSCQCRQWTDLLSLQTSWQLTTPFRYAAVSHQNLTLSDREHGNEPVCEGKEFAIRPPRLMKLVATRPSSPCRCPVTAVSRQFQTNSTNSGASPRWRATSRTNSYPLKDQVRSALDREKHEHCFLCADVAPVSQPHHPP